MSQFASRPRARASVHVSPARRFAVVVIATLAAILALGSVQPAGAATPAPVTKADLCAAWSQAGTSDPEVDLASGLTVTGRTARRGGSSCLASGAYVQLTGASISADGPSAEGNAAAQVVAAVTRLASGGDAGLQQGDELFKGAYLKTFNAALKLGYFDISGEVDVQFTGGTLSRFLFKGKLYGLDRWSMTLSSPVGGTTLPNITGSPISFAGTLSRSGNAYTLDATGSAASLTIGDGAGQLTVTDGSLELTLAGSGDPHLHLGVAGTVGVGAARIAGTAAADFDAAGLTALTATGDLTATIPVQGTPATVTGTATVGYTRDPLARSVRFAGTVTYGDAVVANATGVLDDESVTFHGDVALSGGGLVVKGSVDGLGYFGDDLAGRTITNAAGQQVQASKGDLAITAASATLTAKNLTVGGSFSLGSVAGSVWAKGGGTVDLTIPRAGQPDTVVKGSADIAWTQGGDVTVGFAGSVASGDATTANVAGQADGRKITFTGDLSSPQVSGKASGVVFYGSDLAGESLRTRDGVSVTPTKGDLRVQVTDGRVVLGQVLATGSLALNKVGTDTWVETDAQLKVAQSWLTFSGWVGAAGDFELKAVGQVDFDGYQVPFKGTAVQRSGRLVINGTASVKTGLFTTVLTGTIEKADASSSVYLLTGTADFRFGKSSVAGGTVRLTLGEGMTVTFSVKACILFLCQNGTYKLYFNPDGSVNRAELNAPLTSLPTFLGIGSAALGSKVKIATKITGII